MFCIRNPCNWHFLGAKQLIPRDIKKITLPSPSFCDMASLTAATLLMPYASGLEFLSLPCVCLHRLHHCDSFPTWVHGKGDRHGWPLARPALDGWTKRRPRLCGQHSVPTALRCWHVQKLREDTLSSCCPLGDSEWGWVRADEESRDSKLLGGTIHMRG